MITPLDIIKSKLAEREGFEPSVRFNPYTRLAGEHLRPLGHLSRVEIIPIRLLKIKPPRP